MYRLLSLALVLLPTFILLSGCEFLGLAEEGAVAGAVAGEEVTAASALRSSAGLGTEAGSTQIAVSDGLFGFARDRGVLSTALDDITARGTRTGSVGLTQNGTLFADGRVIGRIDPATGDVMGPRNVPAGYLSASDARIYEYGRNGQSNAIAELHGWTTKNGIELRSATSGSRMTILRSRLYLDVLKISSDRYLIRLPNGETGFLPATDVTLFLIALAQNQSYCDSQRSGTLVLTNGEGVPFLHCRQQSGSYFLDTAQGPQTYSETDVARVLIGGRANLSTNYGFSSAVLHTEPRESWAFYRPVYSPEVLYSFHRQFPRTAFGSWGRTAHSNFISHNGASNNSRYRSAFGYRTQRSRWQNTGPNNWSGHHWGAAYAGRSNTSGWNGRIPSSSWQGNYGHRYQQFPQNRYGGQYRSGWSRSRGSNSRGRWNN